MSNFKQIINPHQHSDGSLDGAATIKQIVARHKELGATHVAITEHGNINTSMELYHVCKDKKMKPIIGIELYIESPFKDILRDKLEREIDEPNLAKKADKIDKKLREAYVHLTVHFKDEWAYKYFCSITPKMEERAVVRWAERKPIITLEELAAASGHITICSGCLVGMVQKWLLPDFFRPDLAEKAYLMIREIAGKDNFFVEVFPHKVTHNWKRPEYDDNKVLKSPGKFEPIQCTPLLYDGDLQRLANHHVLQFAKKYNDPVLISLDSHFATKEQKIIQDAKLGNGKENWRFYNSYHILSTEEAAHELKSSLGVTDQDIERWVDNSYKFASLFDSFKLTTNSDRWVLEKIDNDFMSRLQVLINKYGRMDYKNPQMVERLKYEISVLGFNDKINLLSYFFTIEDISNYCRDNDILINVRGSAGGSLLLYLIGVSAVNPLKHNLSFERFLTLGRIKANTLPDVDIDVSTGGRDKLLEYLNDKYGDRFCHLSIDSLLKLKSSMKDAERALLGKVRPETEALCRTLPGEPTGVESNDFVFGFTDTSGVYHNGLIENNAALKKYSENNPKVWEAVCEMMGIQRQKSVHACGVVIADKPVQEYCPVIKISKTKVTGFSPKSIELSGLVKYDILGLNTLLDIQVCLASIKNRLGVVLNPWDLPYDENVFNEFGLGNTETVFQFDTETVRPYLMSTKPRSIEDLAAITSLCRPGTLDAPNGDGRTLAEVYVARKQGETITYIHRDLEHIMKDTMGIQLYQEQTLQIFRDVGGYTYEEAEAVRRGIGKKNEKVLAEATSTLKNRCLAKGWTEEQVDLLVSQIMASSKYSFNKSHAISYAYVAYACMYLKKHYKLDWWKATLSNAKKDELATKFWRFVSDFTKLPDINNSSDDYVIKGDYLVAPISIMNGIGEKAYLQLVHNAPYTDLKHFVTVHMAKEEDKARSAVHSGIARKLIAAGVLDSLFSDQDMSIDQKLYQFELIKAEVKGEKPKPIPEEFIGITRLGSYLIKKDLISVYSEDLREILLPVRGCKKNPSGHWETQRKVPILNGAQINHMKANVDLLGSIDDTFACVAYVIEEKPLQYSNKTKQATKLFVDCGGTFFEEVLWPDWEGTIAESGFKGYPVMMFYKIWKSRINLKKVQVLIKKEEKIKYNVI